MIYQWIGVALVPWVIQALALVVDEFHLHYKRNLPRWERIGHPLDTLTVLIAMAVPVFNTFSEGALLGFIVAGLASSLFVTKDEWIHSSACNGFEHWLHAVLFICHPMTFMSAGFFWLLRDRPSLFSHSGDGVVFAETALRGQFLLLSGFLVYQVIYWNFVRKKAFVVDAESSLQGKQSKSVGQQ
ncbi:MAG: hypothetical protein RJB13_2461 [Pseudomonadota bacterium]|jgi:hypothetical protein